MANTNVTIRMDEDLKKEADALFDELGMSFTTAVNVFVKQAIRERRIPFGISAFGSEDAAQPVIPSHVAQQTPAGVASTASKTRTGGQTPSGRLRP